MGVVDGRLGHGGGHPKREQVVKPTQRGVGVAVDLPHPTKSDDACTPDGAWMGAWMRQEGPGCARRPGCPRWADVPLGYRRACDWQRGPSSRALLASAGGCEAAFQKQASRTGMGGMDGGCGAVSDADAERRGSRREGRRPKKKDGRLVDTATRRRRPTATARVTTRSQVSPCERVMGARCGRIRRGRQSGRGGEVVASSQQPAGSMCQPLVATVAATETDCGSRGDWRRLAATAASGSAGKIHPEMLAHRPSTS